MTFKNENTQILDGKNYDQDINGFMEGINPYQYLEPFMATTATATEFLPAKARLAVLDFKKRSNQDGYLLIRNLKLEPTLPRTPDKNSDARDRGSYYSEFWLSTFAHLLGEPFSYKQEGDGYLFHNVRPLQKNKDKISSESSDILLDFHTETAFHPFTPDYLMLFCIRSDRDARAETIVSSTSHILEHLDEKTIHILRQKKFRTGIDYSFGNVNTEKGNGPILAVFYGDRDDPLMTFDPDLMIGLDDEAAEALIKLKSAVDKTKYGVLLEPGDLLIVDNRRAVHGRNSFKAYYDGYDRWLQRCLVTRNLQQSEIIFNRRERIISYDFNTLLEATA